MIIDWLRQLKKANYSTLNRIEISRRAILHNLRVLQAEQVSAIIIPVLKANAYGHGLKELAIILNDSPVEMVAVDSYPEAQIVYRYFKRKVLIIGEMPPGAYKYLKWRRTEVCIYSQRNLNAILALNKKLNIHLFVNTGMNREGIKDFASFLKNNEKKLANLNITGICSHLHSADSSNEATEKQLSLFLKCLDLCERYFKSLKYVHLANSAGIFNLHHERLNACRPGLAVYGINPFQSDSPYFKQALKLKPAMEIYSSIVSLQRLEAGEIVSYNANYITSAAEQIVVIPFGYCEGLDRRLSSVAQFKCDNNYLQVAGSICMNMTCLAAENSLKIAIGQEVQIISSNPHDLNSIVNIAKLEKTIVYEVLIKFLANIRRKIVDK